MTKPFKGRPGWVIEFLESPEAGMTCGFSRAIGVLQNQAFNGTLKASTIGL